MEEWGAGDRGLCVSVTHFTALHAYGPSVVIRASYLLKNLPTNPMEWKLILLLDYNGVREAQKSYTVFCRPHNFPGGSDGKESASNVGDLGWRPGLETWVRSLSWDDSLEDGMTTHSTILYQRFPMDRGAWRAIVHGVTKSRTLLSDLAQHTAVRYRVGALTCRRSCP